MSFEELYLRTLQLS